MPTPTTPHALAILPPPEQQRFARTAPPHQLSFLGGRLLLRRLAGELLDVRPEDVVIEAVCADCGGDHGRPALPGTGLDVSLSHAGGFIVAAAAWHCAVGVDVEGAHPAAARLEAIGELTGVASVRHWTRVEAVLKADGRGLRVDPREVEIAGGVGTLQGVEYSLTDLEHADVVGTLAVRAGAAAR